MIAKRFRYVGWVAGVAVAAVGCYLVSLRVASERNELARVERRIVAARADIRQLQTELGTRGRLVQLERWNRDVLALQAPQAQQYLEGSFQLAAYAKPKSADMGEVRLATATAPTAAPVTQVVSYAKPAPAPKPAVAPASPPAAAPAAAEPMLRHATYVKAPAERLAASAPVRKVSAEAPRRSLDEAVFGAIAEAKQPRP